MDVDRLSTKMNRSMIVAAVVLLGGCDTANCLIDRYPQFSRDSLAVATVNQEYADTLLVDINNSIEDNDYDYRVRIEGRLPPGVTLQTSGRNVSFTGTPTQLGDFTFTLNLYAEPSNSGFGFNFGEQAADLCDEEVNQEFVISVVQGF